MYQYLQVRVTNLRPTVLRKPSKFAKLLFKFATAVELNSKLQVYSKKIKAKYVD